MDLARNYLVSLMSPIVNPNRDPRILLEDSLEEQLVCLEREFIDYLRTGAEPDSNTGRFVCALAVRAEAENAGEFETFYEDLHLTPENASMAAREVAVGCLGSRSQCNWGRVATVLAFLRLIAKRLSVVVGGDQFLEAYSTSAGSFLARFVLEWRRSDGREHFGFDFNAQSSSSKCKDAAVTTYFGTVMRIGVTAVTMANAAIR